MQEEAHIAQAEDARLLEQLEYWLGVCRSTQPLDRARSTEAIGAIYHALGKARPDVLFFPSPLMCVLVWSALRGTLASSLDSPLVRDFQDRCWRRFWRSVRIELARRLDSHRFMGQLEVRLEVLHQNLALADTLCDQLSEDIARLYAGDAQPRLASQILSQLEQQGSGLQSPVRTALEDIKRQLSDERFRWKPGIPPTAPLNAYQGPWSCGYEVIFDAAQQEEAQRQRWQLWVQQGTVCHWWFPYEGVVFASDRPRVLTVDERGRLHNEQDAALEYRDGYAVHAWHGVRVEPRVVTDPASITVAEIEDPRRSAAVRRVLLARYGHARYLKGSCATLVHQDSRGKLWRKDRSGDTPLVMVEVERTAADSGASRQSCFLRVPPEITCASDAVDWAFGPGAQTCQPMLDS